MEIKTFLAMMVRHDASGLYFCANAAPAIRIEGKTRALGHQPLGAEIVK